MATADKKWGKSDLDEFLNSLPEVGDASRLQQYPGSCLCGGVRFYLAGEPLKKVFCYCDHCRKNSGGTGQMVTTRWNSLSLSFYFILFYFFSPQSLRP